MVTAQKGTSTVSIGCWKYVAVHEALAGFGARSVCLAACTFAMSVYTEIVRRIAAICYLLSAGKATGRILSVSSSHFSQSVITLLRCQQLTSHVIVVERGGLACTYRARKREQMSHMSVRVAELEAENAALKRALAACNGEFTDAAVAKPL